MGYSFSDFANDRDIKHIFHKVEPVTDAIINKAVGKVQSLKTGGRVKGAKKGAKNSANVSRTNSRAQGDLWLLTISNNSES